VSARRELAEGPDLLDVVIRRAVTLPTVRVADLMCGGRARGRRLRALGRVRLAPAQGGDVNQVPETRYAQGVDGGQVAYQVAGAGPILMLSFDGLVRIEVMWEEPRFVRFLDRLSSFGRHVWFDPRGNGASSSIARADGRVIETIGEDMVAVLRAGRGEGGFAELDVATDVAVRSHAAGAHGRAGPARPECSVPQRRRLPGAR